MISLPVACVKNWPSSELAPVGPTSIPTSDRLYQGTLFGAWAEAVSPAASVSPNSRRFIPHQGTLNIVNGFWAGDEGFRQVGQVGVSMAHQARDVDSLCGDVIERIPVSGWSAVMFETARGAGGRNKMQLRGLQRCQAAVGQARVTGAVKQH